MQRQRPLPLSDDTELDALWDRFPERSRRELITLTGQLIARAAKAPAASNQKESSDDESSR